MSQPKLATARSGWGGRGYAIPGRTKESPKTGKPIKDVYPSVTTVLSQIAKPGLHQWIADQTAAAAVVNLPLLMTRSEEVGWGMLRFAWSKKPDLGDPIREHYMGVRDDAADLGTNIHEIIEAEMDEFAPVPEPMAVETDEMLAAWEEWRAEHHVVSHRSEFTCVNDRLRVAGTADADWTVTCLHEPRVMDVDKDGNPAGKPRLCLNQKPGEAVRCLIDLKSSRNTWRENGYQLAALASGNCIMQEVPEGYEGAMKHETTVAGKKIVSWWVEDDMPTFDRYALLHIRPNDLDVKGNRIPAFCTLKDRTADIDLYLMGFEGALALARSEFELKARAKERLNGIETEDI